MIRSTTALKSEIKNWIFFYWTKLTHSIEPTHERNCLLNVIRIWGNEKKNLMKKKEATKE